MPLVLSLKEGQDFYVDQDQIVIDKIVDDSSFKVLVTKTNRKHLISNLQAEEVLPDVFLSAGPQSSRSAEFPTARIAIEVPDEIRILRGEWFRNGGPPVKFKKGNAS